MQPPKLRDKGQRKGYELYSLGTIPPTTINNFGKWIVYNFCIGKDDISGEDWGGIFSKSINAKHLNSPIGLADVVINGMAWSVKSVKHSSPHECKKARVISGRCSPNFSYNISDPHENIQHTGTCVLGIWNERINIAKDKFEPLRSCLLIRNPDTLEFALYEHELHRFNTNDVLWETNRNGNFVGKSREGNKHLFTWQPHGSQFTIHYDIPDSRIRFKVRRPPVLDFKKTLSQIGFDESWVTIL